MQSYVKPAAHVGVKSWVVLESEAADPAGSKAAVECALGSQACRQLGNLISDTQHAS